MEELWKQVVRPKRMNEAGEEQNLTWGDLKKFCDTLSENDLTQRVWVYGDEKGGGIYAISVAVDEGINASGELVEPRSLYSKSDDPEDREIALEEKTVIDKGTIMLEANF